MRHRSRPTTYKGARFRSRLEARWAAFFDLIGWRWQYEPIDLKGWTPDFVLLPAGTLVEVKPIVWIGEEDDFLLNLDREDLNKVKKHGSALVLGAFPFSFAAGAYLGAQLADGVWTPAPAPADRDAFDDWNRAGALVQWGGA